jgi:hypothetical protein
MKDNIHTAMCPKTVTFIHRFKHYLTFNQTEVYFPKQQCTLLHYPFTPDPMAWPFHEMFTCNKILFNTCFNIVARGGAVVEALRYKLEGHGIDS